MTFIIFVVGFSSNTAFVGSTGLVEQTPCISPFMCPFFVSSGSGKVLVTFLMLRSGHLRQFTRQMALRHVNFVETPMKVSDD